MKKLLMIKGDTAEGLIELVNERLKDGAELMSVDLATLTAAIQVKDEECRCATMGVLRCTDCKYFAADDEPLISGWCSFYGMVKRKDKKASTCKHFSNTYGEVK